MEDDVFELAWPGLLTVLVGSEMVDDHDQIVEPIMDGGEGERGAGSDGITRRGAEFTHPRPLLDLESSLIGVDGHWHTWPFRGEKDRSHSSMPIGVSRGFGTG